LAKGLSDKAKQTLSAEPKARKKSVLDLTGLDEDDRDSAPPTEEAVVNAREQLAAMLSFKEALCSRECASILSLSRCLFFSVFPQLCAMKR
jgi:hypothetical protein